MKNGNGCALATYYSKTQEKERTHAADDKNREGREKNRVFGLLKRARCHKKLADLKNFGNPATGQFGIDILEIFLEFGKGFPLSFIIRELFQPADEHLVYLVVYKFFGFHG
jgi:hypothetical protein